MRIRNNSEKIPFILAVVYIFAHIKKNFLPPPFFINNIFPLDISDFQLIFRIPLDKVTKVSTKSMEASCVTMFCKHSTITKNEAGFSGALLSQPRPAPLPIRPRQADSIVFVMLSTWSAVKI